MDYSEKEIEDCIFDNPHILNLGLKKDGTGWEIYQQLNFKDYGIADIVIFDWNRKIVYIVEVKRDKSKPSDFAQCLRYMRAVQDSGMAVRGIIAANGTGEDSVWLLSNLKHVHQWSFTVDVATGLTWKYELKSGWFKGDGNCGDQLASILDTQGKVVF